MSKPRPPYLHKTITRHGREAWYVWRRPGPKIRIRGEYGSKEFMAQYRAALYGDPIPVQSAPDAPESLAGLIEAYMLSPAWARLSGATKRQRENIFARVRRKAGKLPFTEIDRSLIVETRDAMSGPAAAKHFVQTMRGLFAWAVETGRAQDNPCDDVRVRRPQTEGFYVWSEEEVRRFEARWPVGTRERLALAVLLYTGLRRGDAARLGWEHIREGVIEIQTGKTGAWVTLPILPDLQRIIEASPTGKRTLIARNDGEPFPKESFGNFFREACIAAGVQGRAHGLRKAGATRAAEAGATVHELNALFGWTGAKMASLYTAKADRARLARMAIEKLAKRPKSD